MFDAPRPVRVEDRLEQFGDRRDQTLELEHEPFGSFIGRATSAVRVGLDG